MRRRLAVCAVGDRDRRRGARVRAGRPALPPRPRRGPPVRRFPARRARSSRSGSRRRRPVRARGRSAAPATRRSSCSARRAAAGRRRASATGRPVGGERAAARRRADRRRPRRGPAGRAAHAGCSPARRAPRSRPRPTPAPRWRPDEQLVGGDPPRRRPHAAGGHRRRPTRPRSSRRRPPTATAARSCAWTPTAGIASRSTRREPVRPVALAAAGPARAWMLATAGDRVVLLRRDPSRAALGPRDASTTSCSTARGLRRSRSRAPPADPLTATSDGVWIDLRVTPPGATAPIDLTERLKVTERPPDPRTPTRPPRRRPRRPPRPRADRDRHGERDPDARRRHSWSLDGRWCDAGSALCDHRAGLHVRPRRPRLPLGRHGRDAGREVRHAPDQRARRSRRRRGRARPRRPAPGRLCRAGR